MIESSYVINESVERKKERLFSFLIVFMMFGNTYGVPSLPIGFGELVLVLFMPFYLKTGLNFLSGTAEKLFFIHFIYVAFVSCLLVNYFEAPLSEPIKRIARNGFYYFIIFYLGPNLCNRYYLEKYIICFCIALSLFVCLQFACFRFTGVVIPGVLYNMPMGNGAASGYHIYQASINSIAYWGRYRPNGFLCEPAHVSQSLFVGLLILLHSNYFLKKNRILLALLFTIAVLMSQSSTGIIAMGLAWGTYFFLQKKIDVGKIVIAICACLFILLSQNNSFKSNDESYNAISRIQNSTSKTTADASTNVRIYKGFETFFDLPFAFQMIGTGWGMYESVMKTTRENNTVEQEYSNSFSAILFASGYLGFTLFLLAFGFLFYRSNKLGRLTIVGYWILSLGTSLYVGPVFGWIMFLALMNKE